ncbi:MAG: hypothetical protein ACOYJL_07760 [Tractidigestivibacter sp.]|jgi:hypothetical protein|uniref:hypothetical protein n=1 Tax=Tractidigestivibacter sp. TaxID=2847320 RepID=UPI003D8DEE27
MASGSSNNWSQKFMNGRRGPDDLASFCVVISFILIIISLFTPQSSVLSFIALALVIYAIWRMCSKNVYARIKENNSFLNALGPVRPWIQNPKAAWKEKREYKHVKCPKCGQKIRVPRGKGKLRVTCPKCHEKFEMKS